MDLDKRLASALKKHLEGAKEGKKSGGFEEFDDGRYQAKLIKAEIGESGSGRLQLVLSWKFLKGEYKGKTKFDYRGLESEDNLKYLLLDLDKLGFDTDEVESVSDFKGIAKEISKDKPEAKIALKTKGDFQNVNIVAVKGSDDDEDDEDEDDESDEESDDDEEEEEDDEPKKKKSSKKKKDDDDDDDDEEEEEESDDDDEDEEEEKSSKKKKSKKKDDEDEDDEEDDEEDEDDDEEEEETSDVELSVGSDVTYKFKGKKLKGTVLDIFPKSNEVRVQTGDKKRKVSFDDIVEVEVPEEPKKKKKKVKK
jgi:hypothetical protein